MAIIYSVTVRDDYRWPTAKVGGRTFSKRTITPVPEVGMTDEILNSPLLEVVGTEVGELTPDAPAGDNSASEAEILPAEAPPAEVGESDSKPTKGRRGR